MNKQEIIEALEKAKIHKAGIDIYINDDAEFQPSFPAYKVTDLNENFVTISISVNLNEIIKVEDLNIIEENKNEKEVIK